MKHILALITALFLSIGLSFAAVNVNTATQAELQSLDGIGPVKAKAIIDYRTKNGPFKSLDDLEKVSGIGQSTLKDIKKDVTLTGKTTVAADAKGGEKKGSGKGDKKDGKADTKSDVKAGEKKDAKGAEKKDGKVDAKSDSKASKDASGMKSGSMDSSKDSKARSDMKKSEMAVEKSKSDEGKSKSDMKKSDTAAEKSKSDDGKTKSTK